MIEKLKDFLSSPVSTITINLVALVALGTGIGWLIGLFCGMLLMKVI